MKISIWQQFSSNHSNTFTVVGEFATEEDAARAADKLREIFSRIEAQSRSLDYDPVLVPAEKHYAQEYDIKWDRHLNWIHDSVIYICSLTDYVAVFDKTLFVSPLHNDTWLGAYVVDELVAKLGAKVEKDEEMGDTSLLVTATAQCPDHETAIQLHTQITTYLKLNDEYWQDYSHSIWEQPVVPWAFHFVNKPDVSEQIILDAYKLKQKFEGSCDSLIKQMLELNVAGVPATDERIVKLRDELHDCYSLKETFLSTLSPEEAKIAEWFDCALTHTHPIEQLDHVNDENLMHGVVISGNIVVIKNLRFGNSLGYALPALVNWLRGEGCQVEYSIESREVNG